MGVMTDLGTPDENGHCRLTFDGKPSPFLLAEKSVRNSRSGRWDIRVDPDLSRVEFVDCLAGFPDGLPNRSEGDRLFGRESFPTRGQAIQALWTEIRAAHDPARVKDHAWMIEQSQDRPGLVW